jgi:hypothetical protein
LGWISTTCSPAATSCWASRWPGPPAPSTAQVRSGQPAGSRASSRQHRTCSVSPYRERGRQIPVRPAIWSGRCPGEPDDVAPPVERILIGAHHAEVAASGDRAAPGRGGRPAYPAAAGGGLLHVPHRHAGISLGPGRRGTSPAV